MHTPLISTRPFQTLGVHMFAAACSPCKTERSADSAGADAMMGDARIHSRQMAMPAGAQGMSGMQQDSIVQKVEAYLQRLQTASADSLRALVSDDRQVVTALIADCEQMMRQMKMEAPRKWRNAVQELRADLDRMPGKTGAQLTQAIPEHRNRIERMLAMRHDMMRM